ncbi:MAG TPA: hypothetical protein VE546_05850 [Streptomyces sp.]|uniref:hypothetical protein n=1 Tax=Streptomyces sp. TaxID=1931 RepID=UPI002D5307FE|nr:hypothetical protein [Streptomyces sp.]HZG03087.1 hypothetical protein [Streptomyces sp.]
MPRIAALLRRLLPVVCALVLVALATGDAAGPPPAEPVGIVHATHAPPAEEAAEGRACEGDSALPYGKVRRSDRSLSGEPPPAARIACTANRPGDRMVPAAVSFTPPHPAALSRPGELALRLQVFRC